MTDIAALGLSVDSSDVRRAAPDLDRLTASTRRAEGAAGRMGAAFDAARRQLMAFGAAAAAALSVQSIVRAADAYTQFANALRVAGATGEAFATAQDRLFEAANRNGVAIGALSQLYSRASIASGELGASQGELLRFVDGVTAALRVQGGSTEAASGALFQLGQALGAGVVRAEEFNSILEGAFPIAQAAARGLDAAGGSVARLRSLVIEGKVTSQEFFRALLEGFTATEALAAGMSLTVGASLTVLQNSFIRFVGELDSALGATAALASIIQGIGQALNFLAANMDTVIAAAQTAGIALLAAFGPTILGAVRTLTVAIASGLVGAIRAVAVAVAANPLGALLLAITTVIAAVWSFRDAISEAIGVDIAGVMERTANLIVGAFVGAFNAVRATWSQLPAALGDIAIQTANAVLAAIKEMINGAIWQINRAVSEVQHQLSGTPLAFQFSGIGQIGGDWSVANPFAGSAAGVADAASAAMRDALSRDYFGGAAEAPGALSAPGAASALSTGASDAAKKAAKEAAKAAREAAKAAQDAYDRAIGYWRDFTGSFVDDLRQGLKQGESLWESFANAALNALDRVIDTLINSGLDAVFRTGQPGSDIGSLFSALGSLFGLGPAPGGLFAQGGVFGRGGLVPFASGAVVTSPTMFPMRGGRVGVMGEAGEEAIMPLRRTRGGRLGVEVAGGAGGRAELVVHLAEGLKAELAGQMEGVAVRVVQGGLAAYDRHVAPKTAERIRKDPMRRG